MINDRRPNDPNLQAALNEIRTVMERYDLPGAVMLVNREETVFSYKLDATWSACRKDRAAPLGFRFRAVSSDRTGKAETERRVLGAMHTICQLSDFGEQTTAWMEDLKLMLRRAGIDFTHTSFGGKPLDHIIPEPPAT
jgi:hypothetical protein